MIWYVFTGLMGLVPWALIALAAFMLWMKKKNTAVLAQAIAATLVIIIPLGAGAVLWLLPRLSAPYSVINAIAMGFGFLGFLALLGFAGAYCWERFSGK